LFYGDHRLKPTAIAAANARVGHENWRAGSRELVPDLIFIEYNPQDVVNSGKT
jgi:hypothetical protein